MIENSQKQGNTFFRKLTTFSIKLILIVINSWLAAYLSISLYDKRLEQIKTELAIEQKIIENQMRVIEQVIEKASTLHQLSPLYREYDLIAKFYPQELIETAKLIEKTHVSKEDIINSQKEFQIALFSSKPFIPEKIFEKLALFGARINQFNSISTNDSETLHKIYEAAGNDYNEALKLIRNMYKISLVNRDS